MSPPARTVMPVGGLEEPGRLEPGELATRPSGTRESGRPLRLLVVGDVAWDMFIRPGSGRDRGSDAAGTVDVMPGGAAANVAVWAARLGAAVTLRCKLGDDTLGQLMVAHLDAEGVAVRAIIVPGGSTTHVGVLTPAGGGASRVLGHAKVLSFEDGDLPVALLDGVDAIFFTAYEIFKARSAGFLIALLGEARARHLPLAFDPSSRALARAYGAARLLNDVGRVDVLIANEEEALALSPGGRVAELVRHAALVVVKRGEHGAAACDGHSCVSVAAVPIVAVDTTGAGDGFNAAFLVSWLGGSPLPAALDAGNRLGVHVAGRLGAQPRR